jgi:hypothetical protein
LRSLFSRPYIDRVSSYDIAGSSGEGPWARRKFRRVARASASEGEREAAWGDYWVWDPKENWSLVSWLVYAGYLHLRHVRGWRGDRASWLAIVGFAVVMFTYLGMGMLPTSGESAHVYTN